MIYASRAVGAAANELLPLIEIIGASEQNNRRYDLTSAVIRHDGYFVQMVEGQRAYVDRLLSTLKTDMRHEAMSVLMNEPFSDARLLTRPIVRVEYPDSHEYKLGEVLGRDDAGAYLQDVIVSACRELDGLSGLQGTST